MVIVSSIRYKILLLAIVQDIQVNISAQKYTHDKQITVIITLVKEICSSALYKEI